MSSITPALVIQKKRDGEELSREEIQGFIRGISTGEVADYQATAFLMAVYFQKMTLSETVALTQAMLDSGERYDLSSVEGPKVDKHSTGGVGDKVSLILAPLAAACGLKVPMMAGRGLGHSGGTIDKLEAIPGFDAALSKERFLSTLKTAGCAIIGQSEKIAPADKKLYALRDVTSTVDCIPLIVASILSKKLAEGTEALVLDVKVGNGAFMKTKEEGKKLARTITQVARKAGLPCRALLTDMSQPLGYAVGNTLEVIESIHVLRNKKDSADLSSCDLRELTIQLCSMMLELGGVVHNSNAGRKLAHQKLADGSAWKVFQEMVQAQGGSVEHLLHPEKLPKAPKVTNWTAKKRGYLTKMNTESLGRILIELGGGRKKASDKIDLGVGMLFHKKLGAHVSVGDTLVTVHANPHSNLEELESLFQGAIEITGARKPVPKLVLGEF